jgi:hypothetical protein
MKWVSYSFAPLPHVTIVISFCYLNGCNFTPSYIFHILADHIQNKIEFNRKSTEWEENCKFAVNAMKCEEYKVK